MPTVDPEGARRDPRRRDAEAVPREGGQPQAVGELGRPRQQVFLEVLPHRGAACSKSDDHVMHAHLADLDQACTAMTRFCTMPCTKQHCSS